MTEQSASSEITEDQKEWILIAGVVVLLTVTGVIPGLLAKLFPKVGVWLADSGIFASGGDLVITIMHTKGQPPIGLDFPRILVAVLLGALVLAGGIWYLIQRRRNAA